MNRSLKLLIMVGILVVIGEHITYYLYADSSRGEVEFSGDRAYSILKQLMNLNRYYGAIGRDKVVDFIKKSLSLYVDRVILQKFKEKEKTTSKTFLLTNIIAQQNLEAKKRVILGTHWDTRLWAEEEMVPELRNKPIPGANDGGSGTAVLLALAPVTKKIKSLGIDYIFFDGEEFGRPWNDDYCKGSKYFAKNIREIYPVSLPSHAIIIDMVGDKDQNFYYEINSLENDSKFYELIWRIAKEIGYNSWIAKPKYSIIDDHIPLQKVGIKAVLIIDFDYPYWHTHKDTIDKISKESLERVGVVLYNILKELAKERD